jgi:hypothetical protein
VRAFSKSGVITALICGLTRSIVAIASSTNSIGDTSFLRTCSAWQSRQACQLVWHVFSPAVEPPKPPTSRAFASETPSDVVVSIGVYYSSVNVYDIIAGTTPTVAANSGLAGSNSTEVPLTLTDHMLVIEFGGSA